MGQILALAHWQETRCSLCDSSPAPAETSKHQACSHPASERSSGPQALGNKTKAARARGLCVGTLQKEPKEVHERLGNRKAPESACKIRVSWDVSMGLWSIWPCQASNTCMNKFSSTYQTTSHCRRAKAVGIVSYGNFLQKKLDAPVRSGFDREPWVLVQCLGQGSSRSFPPPKSRLLCFAKDLQNSKLHIAGKALVFALILNRMAASDFQQTIQLNHQEGMPGPSLVHLDSPGFNFAKGFETEFRDG